MTPAEKAAVEAMARAAADAVAHPNDSRDLWTIEAASALAALTTLHPGIGAVLRGEAVVMPREATGSIRGAATSSSNDRYCDSCGSTYADFDRGYAAMLAASPFGTIAAAEQAAKGTLADRLEELWEKRGRQGFELGIVREFAEILRSEDKSPVKALAREFVDGYPTKMWPQGLLVEAFREALAREMRKPERDLDIVAVRAMLAASPYVEKEEGR